MMRQGDVLIVPCDDLPKMVETPREDGHIVLAHGEATGHAHAIHEKMVRYYRDTDGSGWLDVKEPAIVRHEEHAPLKLEEGKYRVLRQREYSPETIRNVAD